jgi:hypothetical protein
MISRRRRRRRIYHICNELKDLVGVQKPETEIKRRTK